MWRSGVPVAVLVLAGCARLLGLEVPEIASDGGGSATIGGTVTGLTGTGLVLENDGSDDKPIAADGAFEFGTQVPIGASYDVTVGAQPTNPSETCSIASGTGVATGDVHDVQVTCAVSAYKIGGTVDGLVAGTRVSLANGTEIANVASGPFTFQTTVASGASFDVTVVAQPTTGGPCTVFGGMGIVGNADVTTVVVNCGTNAFAIGGTVVGLDGTVKLANSANGDTVAITANGTYALPVLVPAASLYNVSVQSEPAYPPAAQTCAVANGIGTANGNVQNVNVTCVTDSFTIGGNVYGLGGQLALEDNGSDDLTIGGNGPFTFATPVSSGGSYAVTIKTQPAMQSCSVANGAGAVKNGKVSDVLVTCGDPGIQCAASYCTAGSQVCCNPGTGATCTAPAACGGLALPCDDTADCPSGHVCCAMTNGAHTHIIGAACITTCMGDVLCDPNAPSPCPGNTTCKPYALLPGYYACS